MSSGTEAALSLREVKVVAEDYPGPEDLVICVGRFRLALGPEWRIDPVAEAFARLGEMGDVEQE
jgi:hypothetical protein